MIVNRVYCRACGISQMNKEISNHILSPLPVPCIHYRLILIFYSPQSKCLSDKIKGGSHGIMNIHKQLCLPTKYVQQWQGEVRHYATMLAEFLDQSNRELQLNNVGKV